jgi:hypothetical protein
MALWLWQWGNLGFCRIAILLDNEGPRPLRTRCFSTVYIGTAFGLCHHHDHDHHHLNAFQGTSKYLWTVVSRISTVIYIIVSIFTPIFISPNFGRLHFRWNRVATR